MSLDKMCHPIGTWRCFGLSSWTRLRSHFEFFKAPTQLSKVEDSWRQLRSGWKWWTRLDSKAEPRMLGSPILMLMAWKSYFSGIEVFVNVIAGFPQSMLLSPWSCCDHDDFEELESRSQGEDLRGTGINSFLWNVFHADGHIHTWVKCVLSQVFGIQCGHVHHTKKTLGRREMELTHFTSRVDWLTSHRASTNSAGNSSPFVQSHDGMLTLPSEEWPYFSLFTFRWKLD